MVLGCLKYDSKRAVYVLLFSDLLEDLIL